jgi:hypothetical protein
MMKSRRMRWAGHAGHMAENRNGYALLVGKPERKILLERPRCRWEDNNKIDLREMGWGAMDWIYLSQDWGQ